jgi:hypothetical protein
MVSFYADEDVRVGLVEELRNLGYNVIRAVEDGRGNKKIPDSDVLLRETQLNRVVLTYNRRHYHRLHSNAPNHAGIVTATFDFDDSALAQRIHAALSASAGIPNQLIRVLKPSSP